jgi:murein DD-endopeptidase MepM/ murein hydrolase activator NlpD
MSKDSRHYTIIIAPNASSKVLKLSIHHKALYIAAGVLGLITLIGIYTVVRVAQNESINFAYNSLKTENERLKQDNEAFQNSYSRLKNQISYIEDVSKTLARQADMESATAVETQVGTGGPETISALDKAADRLESNIRQISDQLRNNHLRLVSIPTGLPVNGYITDGFGMRRNPFGGGGSELHSGLDISVDFGTPVSVTADGLVVWAAPHGGYGNLVAIYHSNGITTRYAHLSKITVEPGQRVRRGDQIGLAGSTGRSTAPHVHYEVRENDQAIDPQRYINPSRP